MDHPFFKDINWSDVEEKKLTPPYIPNVKWIYNNINQIINTSNDTTMRLEDKKARYLTSFSYYTEEKTERQIHRAAS